MHNKVYDEQSFEAPVTFNVTPRRTTVKIKGLNPNFKNAEIVKWINGTAMYYSVIKGGANGQCVKVLGDGNTSLYVGGNIRTWTGANVLLAANTLYEMTFIDDYWYLTQ